MPINLNHTHDAGKFNFCLIRHAVELVLLAAADGTGIAGAVATVGGVTVGSGADLQVGVAAAQAEGVLIGSVEVKGELPAGGVVDGDGGSLSASGGSRGWRGGGVVGGGHCGRGENRQEGDAAKDRHQVALDPAAIAGGLRILDKVVLAISAEGQHLHLAAGGETHLHRVIRGGSVAAVGVVNGEYFRKLQCGREGGLQSSGGRHGRLGGRHG